MSKCSSGGPPPKQAPGAAAPGALTFSLQSGSEPLGRANLDSCIDTEPSSAYLRPLHNQNQRHVTSFVSIELDDYAPSFGSKIPLSRWRPLRKFGQRRKNYSLSRRRPLRNPFPLMAEGRDGGEDRLHGLQSRFTHTPLWIPAFAGMTELFKGLRRERAGVRGNRGNPAPPR